MERLWTERFPYRAATKVCQHDYEQFATVNIVIGIHLLKGTTPDVSMDTFLKDILAHAIGVDKNVQ